RSRGCVTGARTAWHRVPLRLPALEYGRVRPAGGGASVVLGPNRPGEYWQAEDLAHEAGDGRRQGGHVVGVEFWRRLSGLQQMTEAEGAVLPEAVVPPALVAAVDAGDDAARHAGRDLLQRGHDVGIERHQRDGAVVVRRQ